MWVAVIISIAAYARWFYLNALHVGVDEWSAPPWFTIISFDHFLIMAPVEFINIRGGRVSDDTF